MNNSIENSVRANPYPEALTTVLELVISETGLPINQLVEFDKPGNCNLRPLVRNFGSHALILVQEAAGVKAGIRNSDLFDKDNFSVDPILSELGEICDPNFPEAERSNTDVHAEQVVHHNKHWSRRTEYARNKDRRSGRWGKLEKVRRGTGRHR